MNEMNPQQWLPTVPLTPSGRPILLPSEIERFLVSSSDIDPEENPSLPPFKSGLLILTSHRLLWISQDSSSSSSYAHSIPLSSIIHAFPPKKSLKSIFHSPRLRIQLSMNDSGVVDDKGRRSEVVTLVIRGDGGKKGDGEVFFERLWEVLKGKAWEEAERDKKEKELLERRLAMPVVGVSGILRKEQETWENTDKTLQDAFQDLNALMSKAKEMVLLAEKMRLKLLSGAQASAGDEEMGSKEEMQDWLLSVGIASPVTKESAGALYHQQLSRQLADFVKLPLERAGGMFALIDVYCLFNRARGTELISPEDLLQACALWEKLDVYARKNLQTVQPCNA